MTIETGIEQNGTMKPQTMTTKEQAERFAAMVDAWSAAIDSVSREGFRVDAEYNVDAHGDFCGYCGVDAFTHDAYTCPGCGVDTPARRASPRIFKRGERVYLTASAVNGYGMPAEWRSEGVTVTHHDKAGSTQWMHWVQVRGDNGKVASLRPWHFEPKA